MSWMSQLYKTFEDNIDTGHRNEDSLTPVSHKNVIAQLEITLDAEGNFINAKILKKEEGQTLIPVTEDSAGRTGKIPPPHPLCDTLSYVAGDFSKHCLKEKEKEKAKDKFEWYIRDLNAWANSDYKHPKVLAIFTYLQKKELIADLVHSDIVVLEEDGTFKSGNISGQPYEKAMVRFRVLGTKGGVYDGTWEDDTLIQTYIDYYNSRLPGKSDICFLTGEIKNISTKHPIGIIPGNKTAKLISSKDEDGYKYRGRFQNAEQAYALSYEASQKIHSALTWLIKRQGVYIGSQDKRTFVCWNPGGKATPDILDAFGLPDESQPKDTGSSYRQKLNKMLQGYRDQFEEGDQVIVMGLDAATTGRLSITYYNEFDALGFLDRIEYWGATCNWFFQKWSVEDKPYYETETPSFRKIVKCAFGRQRKAYIDDDDEIGRQRKAYIDVDDRILKEQVQRLLKCMLERQPIPANIVQALTERASTPLAYSGGKKGNRETVLSTACAVIAKRQNDLKEGEVKQMELDLNNHDRSYLFGRLLAVLEKVERITYDPIKDKDREPNAIRLQSAFVNHPMQTWAVLDDALRPYFQKLKLGSREYYRGLISEIIGLINESDEASLNQRLKETYLLGYYLQRAELNKKKEEK